MRRMLDLFLLVQFVLMVCLPEHCHIFHYFKAECEQHRFYNVACGDNGVQTD